MSGHAAGRSSVGRWDALVTVLAFAAPVFFILVPLAIFLGYSFFSVHDGTIEKTFSFKNFHETIAFVNALAWICHTEDHHPDVALSFDRCVVRFNTHSVGGISVNDFICAAKVDALVAFVG